ncbi:unnamed protein product [Symbiodinium natans]|uniref:Reverse transcriptase domain-containing protein n=1 Tax=Symbiodinium natans TaxID=878477 RepID=A0A812T0E8_9DINO|nr:unnamed protein product [Symbiodinium natans]
MALAASELQPGLVSWAVLGEHWDSLPDAVQSVLRKNGLAPSQPAEQEDPLIKLLQQHKDALPDQIKAELDKRDPEPFEVALATQDAFKTAVGKLRELGNRKLLLQQRIDNAKAAFTALLSQMQNLQAEIKEAEQKVEKVGGDYHEKVLKTDDEADTMDVEAVLGQLGVQLTQEQQATWKAIQAEHASKRRKAEAMESPPGLGRGDMLGAGVPTKRLGLLQARHLDVMAIHLRNLTLRQLLLDKWVLQVSEDLLSVDLKSSHDLLNWCEAVCTFLAQDECASDLLRVPGGPPFVTGHLRDGTIGSALAAVFHALPLPTFTPETPILEEPAWVLPLRTAKWSPASRAVPFKTTGPMFFSQSLFDDGDTVVSSLDTVEPSVRSRCPKTGTPKSHPRLTRQKKIKEWIGLLDILEAQPVMDMPAKEAELLQWIEDFGEQYDQGSLECWTLNRICQLLERSNDDTLGVIEAIEAVLAGFRKQNTGPKSLLIGSSGGLLTLAPSHRNAATGPAFMSAGKGFVSVSIRFQGWDLLLVNLYLQSGVGPTGGLNPEILSRLAAVLDQTSTQWLVLGDWNCSPAELLRLGFVDKVKGQVVAPGGPTINTGGTLDYAVASKRMAPVLSVSSSWDVPFKPHCAVTVELRVGVADLPVRQLKGFPLEPTALCPDELSMPEVQPGGFWDCSRPIDYEWASFTAGVEEQLFSVQALQDLLVAPDLQSHHLALEIIAQQGRSALKEAVRKSDEAYSQWLEEACKGGMRGPMVAKVIKRMPTKAIGADGWSVQMLKCLAPLQLERLAQFFNTWEGQGAFPTQLSVVLVALINKSEDEERPIGLTPVPYRLWAKIRWPVFEKWLREYAATQDWDRAKKGLSSLDVALRRKLSHEILHRKKRHSVTVLLDLKAFYENVRHDNFVKQAISLKVPPLILNAAMSLYSAQRLISAEHCVSGPIKPTKGLVAGCPFAPGLSKIPFDEILRPAWVSGLAKTIDLYIDDTSFDTEAGNPHTAARRAVQLYKAVVGGLTTAGLPVSLGKTAFVCSSQKVEAALKEYLPESDQIKNAAKDLGIDCTAGRRRAGVQTVGLYGHEAVGLAPKRMHWLRASFAHELGRMSLGSVDLTIDHACPKRPDPAFTIISQHFKAIHRLLGFIPDSQRQHFDDVLPGMWLEDSQAEYPWKRAAGPVGALLCYLLDLGWTPVSADTWKCPEQSHSITTKVGMHHLLCSLSKETDRRGQDSWLFGKERFVLILCDWWRTNLPEPASFPRFRQEWPISSLWARGLLPTPPYPDDGEWVRTTGAWCDGQVICGEAIYFATDGSPGKSKDPRFHRYTWAAIAFKLEGDEPVTIATAVGSLKSPLSVFRAEAAAVKFVAEHSEGNADLTLDCKGILPRVNGTPSIQSADLFDPIRLHAQRLSLNWVSSHLTEEQFRAKFGANQLWRRRANEIVDQLVGTAAEARRDLNFESQIKKRDAVAIQVNSLLAKRAAALLSYDKDQGPLVQRRRVEPQDEQAPEAGPQHVQPPEPLVDNQAQGRRNPGVVLRENPQLEQHNPVHRPPAVVANQAERDEAPGIVLRENPHAPGAGPVLGAPDQDSCSEESEEEPMVPDPIVHPEPPPAPPAAPMLPAPLNFDDMDQEAGAAFAIAGRARNTKPGLVAFKSDLGYPGVFQALPKDLIHVWFNDTGDSTAAYIHNGRTRFGYDAGGGYVLKVGTKQAFGDEVAISALLPKVAATIIGAGSTTLQVLLSGRPWEFRSHLVAWSMVEKVELLTDFGSRNQIHPQWSLYAFALLLQLSRLNAGSWIPKYSLRSFIETLRCVCDVTPLEPYLRRQAVVPCLNDIIAVLPAALKANLEIQMVLMDGRLSDWAHLAALANQ